jgi:multisubunit Na+/H+ antiporter MnhB subunit
MGVPIALLAAVPVATGIEPGWMNAAILDPAIASSLQAPAPLQVELSVGAVFLLSLAVLAVGVMLWRHWRRRALPGWLDRLPAGFGRTDRWQVRYDGLAARCLALHDGQLRHYLRRVLIAALTVSALCWLSVPWPQPVVAEPFDLPLTLMVVVSLVAAAATLWLDSHVAATIALGISGYALAGVFALLHAPDVALAQVLVETLATLSIVLALRQSGQVQPTGTLILATGGNRTVRWLVALGIGGTVGAVTYGVARHPPADSVGAWYAAEGFARTGMADLVTAILADFRALDTAIEILVFAAAAMAIVGVYRHAAVRHG